MNEHPRWLEQVAEQNESAVAEAPVVFEGVLAAAEAVPLAREALFGAAVYRLPFDELGLAWQLGEEVSNPARDPELDARLEGLAGRPEGVDEAEMLRLLAYQTSLMAPPLRVPEEADAAREQLLALGLLERLERDGRSLLTIHPLTDQEVVARTSFEDQVEAHTRAARYWQWRCGRLPRPPQDDVEELLEARYHLLVAGRYEEAHQVSGRLADVLGALGQLATRQGDFREGLGLTLRALAARLESGAGDLARDVGQLLAQREALGEAFDAALAEELESPDSIAAVLELMRQAGSST